MPIEYYDASVTVFQRYLERLLRLIDLAEAHVRSHSRSDESILNARLAPDMLPFESQVKITTNFALRSCFPLAGLPIPPYGEFPPSFDGLRECLKRALSLLVTLKAEQFETSASRKIESQAGKAHIALPAPDFLFQYALPNFFFHLATSYAILRGHGVPLGKADYDGLHKY